MGKVQNEMILILCLFTIAAQASKNTCTDNSRGRCSEVTQFVSFTNSWTCRSCFNIRVQFTFAEAGHPDFDSEDSLTLAFSSQVALVKFAYPVTGIKAHGQDSAGNYLQKVTFDRNVEFGDRRMDFNAEFRELGEPPEISYAYTCPCKNNGKVIPDPFAPEKAASVTTTTVEVTTTKKTTTEKTTTEKTTVAPIAN